MESAVTAGSAENTDFVNTTAAVLAAMGSKIKEFRLTRGLTLQTLATTSGLSPSMLSLIERGRASPSIGSLMLVANSLGVAMSDLLPDGPPTEGKLVTRSSEAKVIETAQLVIRRVLREDRTRRLSVALNEYAPNTGNADSAITHDGFEYGFILEGQLTVTIEEKPHVLDTGDLISYSSRRPHRIWNYSKSLARAIWINVLENSRVTSTAQTAD